MHTRLKHRYDDVLKKVVAVFSKNKRVQAIILNGSRANPHAKIDDCSDYDVHMLVDDYTRFKNDLSWLEPFGAVAMKQVNPSKGERLFYNDDMRGCAVLVLFKDDKRIDFSFSNYAEFDTQNADSLSIVLYDKTNTLKLSKPTEKDYYFEEPNQDTFDFVENEFYWCLTNVMKGLVRNEIPYAKSMFDVHVRQAFVAMITWYCTTIHGRAINVGKYGKWLKHYCDETTYKSFLKTYVDGSINAMTKAVFKSVELFESIAPRVAQHYDLTHDHHSITHVIKHLKRLSKALD